MFQKSNMNTEQTELGEADTGQRPLGAGRSHGSFRGPHIGPAL